MRDEELLEQCLQALSSGQELPAEAARYLARHPEKRAEIEDLLLIAQRAARLPSVELRADRRAAMQSRLAARLGFDPAELDAPVEAEHHAGVRSGKRKPFLTIGRISLSKLQYAPPATHSEEEAAARISSAFADLTQDDIRRYIGVRGIDYLYYRQRFPGWEPVFAFLAVVLRGFKRLEKLANLY